MEVALLREFLTVAQCRSLTDAAKRHFISQSTLSGHIKSLEHEMGVVLFHREKPLRLTAAGTALVKHASVLVAQYDIMVDAVKAVSQEGDEVTVSLNVSDTAAFSAWRIFLNSLAADLPHLAVHEVGTHQGTALDALAADSSDCVLMTIEPLQSDLDAGLKCVYLEPVVDDSLYVWAHASHPLAGRSGVKWSDLQDIVHPSNTYLFPLWAASIKNALESNGATVLVLEDQTEGLGFLFSLGENEVQIFDDTYRTNPLFAKIPDRVFVPIDEDNAHDRAFLVYDPAHVSPALATLLDYMGG